MYFPPLKPVVVLSASCIASFGETKTILHSGSGEYVEQTKLETETLPFVFRNVNEKAEILVSQSLSGELLLNIRELTVLSIIGTGNTTQLLATLIQFFSMSA